MNEPPVGLIRRFGAAIESLIDEKLDAHVCRHHPRPDTWPLLAIARAEVPLTDGQLTQAVALLDAGESLYTVASLLDVPLGALELSLARWRARWERLLLRETTG